MSENSHNNLVDAVSVIWLDDTINTSTHNLDTQTLVRQIVKGRLLTFDDPDACVDHITTETITQKIFFIVSNKFGQNVVPLIYDIPEIQNIYVYCQNRQRAEEWAKPHLKVCGIFTKKEPLLRQIGDDVGACGGDDDGLPMSVFHLAEKENSLRQLTTESVKFMWYQSILLVLRLLAKYCNSKTEMIAECQAHYHENKTVQTKIKEFEKNYAPTEAFHWYTSDSFVYRLLNRALRTQNIEIIFKFRFFINDLHNQIQELYQKNFVTHISQTKNGLTVYRGQRITMSELDVLKKNVNQLISMNSFLSATTIRYIAEIFADTTDQCNETSPLQSVLFIIQICNISKDTTAFAFIQNYSCNPDEEEVLFTIGAIFKVTSFIEDKEKKMWHVHLQLNEQQNDVCQDFFRYMIKQIGSEPSPLSFGWFLYRMNDFDKAERYIELMLKQFPPNDKEIGNSYNLLGLIYKDRKLLQKSVDCYKKALEVYSHPSYHNNSQVVATHYSLGLAYLALDDTQNANEHLKQADLKLVDSPQANHPLLIAMTDTLKGKIQAADGNYISALEKLKVALGRKKQTLPPNHPSIATALNEIGVVQEKMGNDDEALKYFKLALEISRQCLSLENFDLADYYANIGRIYYKREQYALAIEQFNMALKIITDSTREEPENISTILACIKETQQKLNHINNNSRKK